MRSFPALRAATCRVLGSGVLLLFTGCAHSRPTAGASADASADAVGVGYGTQAATELTHPVESVDSGQLGSVKVGRVEELLQGRLSGVQVVRTADGGFSVRIRGGGIGSRPGEPLYVIDGVPLRLSPGQGLTWLNPADIARIDVLKGAAAGIYGSTGGNGVVLITTRR
jgi:TonB-dependent starch-binding outer membrane protein SusC